MLTISIAKLMNRTPSARHWIGRKHKHIYYVIRKYLYNTNDICVLDRGWCRARGSRMYMGCFFGIYVLVCLTRSPTSIYTASHMCRAQVVNVYAQCAQEVVHDVILILYVQVELTCRNIYQNLSRKNKSGRNVPKAFLYRLILNV